MKKSTCQILALSALLTLTSFPSCKKKDDDKPANADLIGKWNLVKILYHETSPQDNDDDSDLYVNNEYLEFKADSTLLLVDESAETARWFRKNKILSIISDGDTAAYDIQTLTTSDLKFRNIETEGNYTYEETWFLTR